MALPSIQLIVAEIQNKTAANVARSENAAAIANARAIDAASSAASGLKSAGVAELYSQNAATSSAAAAQAVVQFSVQLATLNAAVASSQTNAAAAASSATSAATSAADLQLAANLASNSSISAAANATNSADSATAAANSALAAANSDTSAAAQAAAAAASAAAAAASAADAAAGASSIATNTLLSGFTSGPGTVTEADSILTAFQKIYGNDLLKAPLANPAFTGVVAAPSISINNKSTRGASSLTTISILSTALVTIATSAVTTMKLIIHAVSGTNRQATELLVLNNGTTASATEYGTVVIGTSLFSVDVAITGGSLVVNVTSTTVTNTNYIADYTYL